MREIKFRLWDNEIKKEVKIMLNSEAEKVKKYITSHPDYKISDIQRLILKGYIYTYKLLEKIGER